MAEIENCYRFVGAKVEGLRKKLGWTQAQLAEKVGVTAGQIAHVERGRVRLFLHQIEHFAHAFGTTEKELLRGLWF